MMTGTYYPVGGAICRLVNKDPQMKCSVQSTGGSVYNVNNVLKKELNFGFVQSDVVYDKFNGVGKFEGNGDQNLRARRVRNGRLDGDRPGHRGTPAAAQLPVNEKFHPVAQHSIPKIAPEGAKIELSAAQPGLETRRIPVFPHSKSKASR